MEVKINLVLDDLDLDSGSLSDSVRDEVISSVTSKVLKGINEKCFDSIKSQVNAKIDSRLNEILESFLEKGFVKRDEWGDVIGKEIKIIDLLKERLDEYFLENVDSYGEKSSRYSNGRPRYERILDEKVSDQIEEFQTKISKDVLEGIKDDISDATRKRITNAILRDYDLKELIK